MEGMYKEHKIFGKTDKSAILVNEKSMFIARKGTKGWQYGVNPLGVVTILPGVQIELGRTMTELIQCLKEVRKPIGLHKIADIGSQANWNIIRIPTGKVPEAVVCKITTIQDIIVSVSFNKSLVKNAEYRRYQPLSAMHQLTAGKVGDIALWSSAVSAVATMTGEKKSNLIIKANDKTLMVRTAIRELENQYRYTFTKDSEDVFNLLSISFLAKK